MQWNKVTLVGVGLLGGSLGLALKARQLAGHVHGVVRRKASVAEALAKGAVDEASLELESAVADADLVVLCTPVAQMKPLAQAMASHLPAGVLVTDVGSVKESVSKALSPIIDGARGHFVGSHPMAGSHRTGVAEARADLFEGAPCVVTPTSSSDPQAVSRLVALWEALGARPILLNPDEHDNLVCRASHLPHLVATALARYVLDPAFPEAQARVCSTGFGDTTRVASGSPEMWRDICLSNRKHLSGVLEAWGRQLEEVRSLLDGADAEGLERFFQEAKARRDRWQLSRGDRAAEPGGTSDGAA